MHGYYNTCSSANSQMRVADVVPVTRTFTRSPTRWVPRGKTAVLFCEVRPTNWSVLRFDTPSTSTSNSRPMSRRFDSADSSFCSAIMRLRRSILTSSGTLSGIVRAARVPGRSEYLNMNAASNPTSRISESVSRKSSSVSS